MPTLQVVPRPRTFTATDGVFKPPAKLTVSVDEILKSAAAQIAAELGATLTKSIAVIVVNPKPDADVGDEGYTLMTDNQGMILRASTPVGALNGVRTIKQLLAAGDVPCGTIADAPAYRWRGIMLDCCRHFFSVAFIKRTIDLIASLKFNTFHWHLTEDQGWRIEIKKYPKLTEIGAWRDDGHGGKYGGFYTQDDIRDVVAYAAARHVAVVPEIEMPGHSTAAITAYPELSCTGGPFKVANTWGVFEDVYCAGKDRTFEFIFDVLTEVMTLFPGPFIHVGGDECPKSRWKKCPDCQARIKAEKLKDEHQLQSYFIGRVDRWLSDHGRRLIGWDEILEGGLAPCAAVMSWRGTAGGIEAAKAEHDVVMSPGTHCYLDHYQSLSPDQPKAIGGFTPIEKVYAFDPMPAGLPAAGRPHILGGQGNLWTEYIPTEAQADYMLWPRAVALAEALWTHAESKSWDDFATRLPAVLSRLKTAGVQYFVDPHPDAVVIGEWSPQTSSATAATHQWELTPLVAHSKSPGEVAVQFVYTGGRNRLDIAWAALLEDGKEIARDTHPGTTGAATHDSRYQLAVPALKAGSKYAITAEVRTDGGVDSAGRIVAWPAQPR
jgi:hexosaminidase